jgi:hypothetical protein
MNKVINSQDRKIMGFLNDLFVYFWRDIRQWTRAYSFTRFLDHTQRRSTVGRTPLEE